ncbi:MAG: PQQ-dependent sugar dehydrogenase, partial [Henriciella sp.]|nr:PQQ-dependent sugar dehydrogenase [Henriciella sp.]
GTLLVTLGEGSRHMDDAPNTDSLHGKVARLNTDGTLPADNPFAGGGGHPAVYTYGHRNVQGLQVDAVRGIVWEHEHGPKGGDEINVLTAGSNYGWPLVTFGINYDGTILTPDTEMDGVQSPVHKWVPSIAPSGMALVRTTSFPDWTGDLLIGAMSGPKGQKLVRIDLDEAGNIPGSQDLLADLVIAYRDVISTPDAIYLATADLDGAIYRLEKTE